VRDIELQSTILTAKDIRGIPREEADVKGNAHPFASGPSMQPNSVLYRKNLKTRPRLAIFLSVIALLLWAVGVFFYNINYFILFDAEKWWFEPFTVNNIIVTSIGTLKEQWIVALTIGIFSFTPLFRRAIHDRLLAKDELRLFLVFAGLQAIYLAHTYYEHTLGQNKMSYGVFMVVIVALLGGPKLGVQFGVFHALTSALLFHYYIIGIQDQNPQTFLKTVLTELHLLVPIWVGWLIGYVGQLLKQRRFSWPLLFLFGFMVEFTIMFCTLISTWAPSWYFQRFFHNFLITPLLLLVFAWLVYYHLSFNSSTLKMTQTELALAEAELKALRAQINPHFMVNSLSVIHHLVRTQPETARGLILDLSDLFQHTLRAGDFVPLSRELEHVRAYLALEQARLTKRLNVMWTILAEDKLDTPVPTLVLQPIVENAIVHGISPKPEGGTVSILVKQVADELYIQVIDNGVGFDTKSSREDRERPSIGFKNIDLRLRLLYGDAYRIQVDSTPGAGTTVELRIPITNDLSLEPSRPPKELTHA
jgi:LytS/YehU family sensor histidine kinase